MKNVTFFNLKIFSFGGKIFYIFEKACFRNEKDKELRCHSVYGKYGLCYFQVLIYMHGELFALDTIIRINAMTVNSVNI